MPKRPVSPSNDSSLSIVLCGAAGQGVQTIEQALAAVLKRAGYHVFSTKEYMSRVRGGLNSTSLRVASRRVAAPVGRIDILVALAAGAVDHLSHRIGKQTRIVGEREVVGDIERLVDLPLRTIASEAGGKLYANTVAVGYLLGVMGVELGVLETYLHERFEAKGGSVVDANVAAARRGHELGGHLDPSGALARTARPRKGVSDELLLNGGDAVTLGAIAGGCDFVASYPMSPSTSVLVGMAKHSHEFGIVVEQAEDEIAAINMGLGAWYAGARALVTTSGGGFALMSEGLSLAGCIESPIVIHLAQRPGPATGLPTRTEQGDLNLALYAGHGEFARAIFAPGTLEQAYELTRQAFEIADEFQIPAFVLTDQYLMDTYYNISGLEPPRQAPVNHIVKTDKSYRRYALAKSGISERGIPGYGTGIVCVDSDEHTEAGYITESGEVRTAMVRKRLARLEKLRSRALRPRRLGPRDARTLLVTWGTTFHAAREALERVGHDDVALVHFSQVYPLNPASTRVFENARTVVVLENNATGQFAALLRSELGVRIDDRVTKYDGHAFTVEQIADTIKRITAPNPPKRRTR